jgi:hypothetical protein
MRLSRSAAFVALVAVLVTLGLLAGLDAARRHSGAEARFAANRALARWFVLTDPCLFTDARYTRHPSLADLHSAFQDYPLALEHFPSGALVVPPLHLAGPASGGGDSWPGPGSGPR